MPSEITSLTNPKIKKLVNLRTHKHRVKTGLTIVEGVREITRALEAKVNITEVYVCPESLEGEHTSILKKIKSRKIPIFQTPKKVFAKISYGDRNEGILAVCKLKLASLKDCRIKKNSIYVIVESVEKPGNLGAILRSCDGAGVDGVIICNEKTDLFNPNVIRASIGTVFSLNVYVSSNEEAHKFLKSRKVKVYSALPYASTIYTKAELDGPVAIVVGNEQSGLTDFWVQNADVQIRIPMRGQADSLNVSSSTAILLYEILRQQNV